MSQLNNVIFQRSVVQVFVLVLLSHPLYRHIYTQFDVVDDFASPEATDSYTAVQSDHVHGEAPPTQSSQLPVIKEYLLNELDARSFLLCPPKHYISSLRYFYLRHETLNTTGLTDRQIAMNDGVGVFTLTLSDALAASAGLSSDEQVDLASTPAFPIKRRFERSERGSCARQSLIQLLRSPSMFARKSCDSLRLCVGHRGCSFRFGNDFCRSDALPMTRKFVFVSLRCDTRQQFAADLNSSIAILTARVSLRVPKLHVNSPPGFNSFKDFAQSINRSELFNGSGDVVNLSYESLNEKGSRDFDRVIVRKNLIAQEHVFDVKCPPIETAKRIGYYGDCKAPELSTSNSLSSLWTRLGRTPDVNCRSELQQVFCSYQYNPNGLCFPPFFTHKRNHSVHLSFTSFPENGNRPDISEYKKLLHHPDTSLIPTRLAFFIMAYSSPSALLQLLQLIYRPQHYYVFHLDSRSPFLLRNSLVNTVEKNFPNNSNIHILPIERSFPSSWGSHYIARSILEGIEELSRMGLWDFFINLSGTDLPIRNIDDLSLTLAPYRGRSFVRLNHFNPNETVNIDAHHTAWFTCGSHLYNVTHRKKSPDSDFFSDLTLSHSTWVVLSIEFAHYLISRSRDSIFNLHHYYLLTSLIPDESYIGTILHKSLFSKSALNANLLYQKPFHGTNIDNLCRHQDETDICGMGPTKFKTEDIEHLVRPSLTSFFARKFSSNPTNIVRKTLKDYLESNHLYFFMQSQFSYPLLRRLAHMAMSEISLDPSIFRIHDTINWRVLPLFEINNACCKKALHFGVAGSAHFRHILEFNVSSNAGEFHSLRSAFIPYSTNQCYPKGHIRKIYATTHFLQSQIPKEQFDREVPNPVNPGLAHGVWLNLFIDLENISPECSILDQTSSEDIHFAEFPLKNHREENGEALFFEGQVQNMNGFVACGTEFHIQLSNETLQDRNYLFFEYLIPCVTELTDGWWKVVFKEKYRQNSFMYSTDLFVLKDLSVLEYIDEDTIKYLFNHDKTIISDKDKSFEQNLYHFVPLNKNNSLKDFDWNILKQQTGAQNIKIVDYLIAKILPAANSILSWLGSQPIYFYCLLLVFMSFSFIKLFTQHQRIYLMLLIKSKIIQIIFMIGIIILLLGQIIHLINQTNKGL